MRRHDANAWRLAPAVDLLERADRLRRQLFQMGQAGNAPCWEPPVDMYGNERELGLLVALPGSAPGQFEAALENQAIVVRGERAFGASIGPGAILRLAHMLLENGCLKLAPERLE